jgi:hypothetical protein
MPAPGTKKTPDNFPNGNWSFGPLAVKWDLKSNNEIDVSVSVLGFQIDKLSGGISPNNSSVTDNVNVLGLITGTVTLEGDYTAGASTNGLYVKGQLAGPGFDLPKFSYRIIAW